MLTIKDIAKEAGFSHSVVSRALSQNPDKNARVAPDTRAFIEETAQRMGYQRNRVAEFMKRGKQAAIGVFMPEYSNRLGADLMMGISEAATENGFPCNFYFGMCLESFERFISANIKNPCSGIISYPFYKGDSAGIGKLVRKYTASGGKTILLNSSDHPNVPAVCIDEVEGTRLAAEHLIQRKCSRYLIDNSRASRSDAFYTNMEHFGQSGRCEMFDPETFDSILTELTSGAGELPVGIFAMTDENAAVMIRKINRTKLRFGKDIFLVGYDDLMLSGQLDPALTTIHQPFRQEGRRAVEKLISIIYGNHEESEFIAPFLVKRETT